MANSVVTICNLALQKLGSSGIVVIDEDSTNGRACNTCYDIMRQRELRAHPWSFSIQRFVLAPTTAVPLFTYLYAFPIPPNCMRVLLPARSGLDWRLESFQGQTMIMTNDGTSLSVKCLIDIVDTTRFDPLFVEALACKMAWHMCEQVTQSNTKKDALKQEYKDVIAEARKANAFEKIVDDQPVDTWISARINGTMFGDSAWQSGTSWAGSGGWTY
jgi:hypothetical protein